MEGGAEGEVGEGGAGFEGEREGGAAAEVGVGGGVEVEKKGVAGKGEGEVVVDEEGQVVWRWGWDGVSPEEAGVPLFHSVRVVELLRLRPALPPLFFSDSKDDVGLYL